MGRRELPRPARREAERHLRRLGATLDREVRSSALLAGRDLEPRGVPAAWWRDQVADLMRTYADGIARPTPTGAPTEGRPTVTPTEADDRLKELVTASLVAHLADEPDRPADRTLVTQLVEELDQDAAQAVLVRASALIAGLLSLIGETAAVHDDIAAVYGSADPQVIWQRLARPYTDGAED